MKIDVNVLGKQNIVSTTDSKKMKLSEHAKSMVFQLFTKNVYSNPIGTVVREITSNCFDSHIEAGVNHPVLIKKTYDEQTETTYISFIDYGVGISPSRVENVYGVYFESTKRQNNNEIGGYGIGAKSILAYKRYSGEGEGEYDNSFFVITNYNGIKYYYNIFEGQESPEYSLIHQEETEERNGTEIRVPVLEKDLHKFETEFHRQLYYFENVIFEGFSDYVKNDYTIVRGKNFLHRDSSLDSNMHVCLGRVYYPIDYNVLGLNQYDYAIPVAIDVPIGMISVTVSRESLDYSESTISYLKKRLAEAKSELVDLLSIQYGNIVTLEDYFRVKNNFGQLKLKGNKYIDLKSVVSKKEINYSNFKYKDIKMPESGVLFDLFFKVNRYGNKEKTSYYGQQNDEADKFKQSYMGVVECTNIYYSKEKNYSRKRLLQSYLKMDNLGRFYVITKKSLSDLMTNVESVFNVHFDSKEKFLSGNLYEKLMKMQTDFFDIIQKNAEEYQKVHIPEDYIESYKEKKKLPKDILKKTIPTKLHGHWGKQRIKISDFINFNGHIFYSDTLEERECSMIYNLYIDLFGSKHVAYSYSDYYKKFSGENLSIMFITISKTNLKYVKYFKNASHISQFYNKIGRRKVDDFIKLYKNKDIIRRFENLTEFYKSELFSQISKKWGKKILQVKKYIDNLPNNISDHHLSQYKDFFSQYVDLFNIKEDNDMQRINKILDELEEIREINSEVLSYIRTPSSSFAIISEERDKKILSGLLTKLLTF